MVLMGRITTAATVAGTIEGRETRGRETRLEYLIRRRWLMKPRRFFMPVIDVVEKRCL